MTGAQPWTGPPSPELLAEVELSLRFLPDAGDATDADSAVHLKAVWDLADDQLMIELDFRASEDGGQTWATTERGGCYLSRTHTALLLRFLVDAMQLDPRTAK